MEKEKKIVGEDMICPVTNKHCDDECCPVGAECNLSGNTLQSGDEIVVPDYSARNIPTIRLVTLQNAEIAKFMGAEFHPNWQWHKDAEGQGPTWVYSIPPTQHSSYAWEERQMQYHNSYEWIMGVVAKIESMGYDTTIRYTRTLTGNFHQCIITKRNDVIAETLESMEAVNNAEKYTKIEAIYIAVKNFIRSLPKQNSI